MGLRSFLVLVLSLRQDARYQHGCGLFLFVQYLCVYLRCREVAMSEQLAHGVNVNAEVEHHNRECMPSAMKCDMFIYPGTATPCPDCAVRACRYRQPGKDEGLRLGAVAHQRHGLRRNIEVLEASGLLLRKYDARKFALSVNLSPRKCGHVAISQPGKTREKERSAKHAIATRGFGKSAKLVNGEVLARGLNSFNIANGGGR